jgi:hypothetical protein
MLVVNDLLHILDMGMEIVEAIVFINLGGILLGPTLLLVSSCVIIYSISFGSVGWMKNDDGLTEPR